MNPVRLLRKLAAKILCRSKRQKAAADKMSPSQAVTIPYFWAPIIFLVLQSLAATFGALDLIVPDLPIPINLETGRAFHLNLSVLWPLLGCMGASYYFLWKKAKVSCTARL